MGVNSAALITHLKMQVGAGCVAGCPDTSNLDAAGDALPTADVDGALVGIQGLPAIPMVDDRQIAITGVVPTGINYHTAVGGIDRISYIPGNINSRVVGIRSVIIARDPMFGSWPNKRAGPNRSA